MTDLHQAIICQYKDRYCEIGWGGDMGMFWPSQSILQLFAWCFLTATWRNSLQRRGMAKGN